VAPSNVYPTADGQMVIIAANQDTVFGRLADAMGRPELASDERYATHVARGAHQGELDELISVWSAGLDAEALNEVLERHGVPTGHIYRAPEMLADPHFAAREAIVRLAHPDIGELPMQNVVPKLSDTPGQLRWPGPDLGAHNSEVLVDLLGLSDDELADLVAAGIV